MEQLVFDSIKIEDVKTYLLNMIRNNREPSGSELLNEVENKFGWQVRWSICDIIKNLIEDKSLTRIGKEYFIEMVDENSEHSIANALNGQAADNNIFKSTLDALLEDGQKYRKSADFREMVEFMAKFRRYSPYNNMLVKIQNPHCSFYASKYDWYNRFGRELKEDAKPMLILAPMHPVMLVYDLDETEGEELPQRIKDFAQFEGDWNSKWLEYLIDNAKKYMIRVDFKKHSTTSAGFATIVRGKTSDKMRISIHNELDEPSRFGVLCHELAHIFLGHLGSDQDRWWPSRQNLNHDSVEIEAEAVAFTVTQRLGLKGSSDAYVSTYLNNEIIPEGISIDYIAKIAGKIEEMAKGAVPTPKRKSQPKGNSRNK